MGLWSMTTVVGPVAGPLLGGALVDNVGWPSIFFINMPRGGALRRRRLALPGRRETATVRTRSISPVWPF